jgi:hypothetical protein
VGKRDDKPDGIYFPLGFCWLEVGTAGPTSSLPAQFWEIGQLDGACEVLNSAGRQ